ncbi:butyrophilin-like protein 2 [Maylandia zebra]|uniref:butyrophilin-like protein 2 n=1 Tax=Maylandia zebra TaxID=106582 RepID=UPI00403C116A
MELPPLLFLSFCFLTLSGRTFAAESETPVARVTVREDDDVILPCSLDTNENIESMLFDWVKEVPRKEVFMYRNRSHYNNGLPGQDVEFKGRVSHYPEELKYGNASIRLKQTRLEDKGTYTCIFPEIKPREKIFRIELVVGAAPKPYVTILKEKGLLQCQVPGASPKPTVEWWDSDNKTLPFKTVQDEEQQGRFHVTVQTTVTEPGCYHCVATQMEKWHRISSEICVHHGLPEWAAILIGGFIVVVIVVAVAVGVVLKVKGYSLKKDSQRMENGPSSELERNLTSHSEQP